MSSALLRTTHKLFRPNAPDYAFATPGDRQLLLDFGIDAHDADPTIDGYRFFCEEAQDCSAPTRLIPGSFVDSQLDALRCGSAERTAASGFAEGLENGVSYNVSVASVDTYGNVSPLSPIACATPVAAPAVPPAPSESNETSSACSFSSRPEPLPMLAVLGLSALGFVRRRSGQAGQDRGERQIRDAGHAVGCAVVDPDDVTVLH